jgi:dienelactone hydrolase
MMSFVLTLLLLAQTEKPAPAHNVERQTALAQALVAQLAAGEFDKVTEPFDATMKKAFPAASIKGVWEGTLALYGKFEKAGETRAEAAPPCNIIFVTMHFARGRLDAKVVFNAEDKIAGFFFVPAGKYESPAYVKPAAFREVEIQVGKGLFPLAGTLAIPSGDGPFPAVILVHGSGPQDRDETIGPNKPFRDLAQGLASQGIAVLRYEKRTKQHPLAMALLGSSLTVKEETVNDAAAAVETLAVQEKIDPQRIFVLGHSLGGMLIPRIAAASDKAAGFISLAGSTRPMEDLVLEQTKYILSLEGEPSDENRKQLAQVEQQVAKVKSEELTAQTPASELPLGVPPQYWLDLRGYDPAAAAKKITQPLLILQGERDYQVTLADFARWREALDERKNVKLITYPQLNHLFMAGKGKSVPAEYFQPGNVDETVINDIAKWIREQHGK